MAFPLLRRRRPTAAEIIQGSLHSGDYRTAALFLTAGWLEALDELRDEATEPAALTPALKALELVAVTGAIDR